MKETVTKRRSVHTFFQLRRTPPNDDARRPRLSRLLARAFSFTPTTSWRTSPPRSPRWRGYRSWTRASRDRARHRRLLQEPRGEPADVLAAKDDDGGRPRGPGGARAGSNASSAASFRRTAGEEARRSSERPPRCGAPSSSATRASWRPPLRVSSEAPRSSSPGESPTRRRRRSVDRPPRSLDRPRRRRRAKRTGRTGRLLLPPPLASAAAARRTCPRTLPRESW